MKKLLTVTLTVLASCILVACGNQQLSYEALPDHIGDLGPRKSIPTRSVYIDDELFGDEEYLSAEKPLYDEHTAQRTRNLKKEVEEFQYRIKNIKKMIKNGEVDGYNKDGYYYASDLYSDAYFDYGLIDKYVKDGKDKKELKKDMLKILNEFKNIYESKK